MISVVIPSAGMLTPDGKPYLAGALDAVQWADEIIVVTTNGNVTQEALLVCAFSECRVISTQSEEFNFSRAINAGVEAAEGDDLILLNDDISLAAKTPDSWIEELSDKRGDIVGVRLVDAAEEIIEHAGIVFAAAGGMPTHIGYGQPNGGHIWKDMPALGVTGAAMLVRRRAFRKLRGFDERFPLNYNDVDFCLRAKRAGMRITQANTLTLVHRESSTRGPHAHPTEEDFHRLYKRHGAWLRNRHGILMDPFTANRWMEGVRAAAG